MFAKAGVHYGCWLFIFMVKKGGEKRDEAINYIFNSHETGFEKT